MKNTLTATLAAVLVAGSAAALAQSAAPAGDAARGHALYMKDMCWTCHATDGHGTQYGPRLAPHAMAWDGFTHQVREPRSSMPPYGSKFVTDQDLADIHAYLEGIRPGRPAKDIALLKE